MKIRVFKLLAQSTTAALIMGMLVAGPAHAAVSCPVTGTSPSQTVTVTMTGSSATATIKRGGTGSSDSDPILVDTTICAATIGSTSAIAWSLPTTGTAGQTVTIDLSGGLFQRSSGTEIAWSAIDMGPATDSFAIAGRSVADSIRIGTTGFDLDGDGSFDMAQTTAFTNVESFNVNGGADNDTLSANGRANDGTNPLATAITLTGGLGRDSLTGGTVNDTLSGGDGRDTLEGLAGNDSLTGGNGSDFASYATSTSPVTVNLSTVNSSQDTINAGSDTFTDAIEGAIGGSGNDTLTGDTGDNSLIGLAGDDALTGGAGNDSLLGWIGHDTLNGDAGTDHLNGGLGNDVIDGGTGRDTIEFLGASASVSVDLGTSTVSGGDGADPIVNVENIAGSHFADSLTGSSLSNVIWGYNGDDTIDGSGGFDKCWGGAGSDTIRNCEAGNGNGVSSLSSTSSYTRTMDSRDTVASRTNIFAGGLKRSLRLLRLAQSLAR